MDQEAKAPESILGVVPEDDINEDEGTPQVTTQPTIEESQEVLRPKVINSHIHGIGDVVIRKLGFHAKTDLFKILAGVVNDLIDAGDDVQTVLSKFDFSPETINALKGGNAQGNQVQQVETVLRLVIKFALQAPSLLDELFLVALQVKPEDRAAYLAAFHEPDFDDATAFGILNAFIDMNGEAFKDFFEGWRGLFEKAAKIRQNLS